MKAYRKGDTVKKFSDTNCQDVTVTVNGSHISLTFDWGDLGKKSNFLIKIGYEDVAPLVRQLLKLSPKTLHEYSVQELAQEIAGRS